MNWIFEAYKIIDSLIMFNVSYLIESTSYLINTVCGLDYNNIATTIFLSYVDTKVVVNKYGNYVYTNNANMRYAYDWYVYGIRYANSIIYKYRIEPKRDDWISLSILFKNKDTYFTTANYTYLEDYQYIKPRNSSDTCINEYYNRGLTFFTNRAKSIVETSEHIEETLLTMKLPTITISRSFNANNIHNTEYSNVKSTVSLLSVVYSHPRMEDKIVMDLPREHFYVNNIILSPLFIKRYLDYQQTPYIFDDTYTINIMDNMINMISLTSKNSILLKESTYVVTTNE